MKKIGERKIRLNIGRLEPRDGRDYAELLLWGDVHFGHPCSDIARAQRNIDYCVENGIYVVGMGDFIEAGTRDSIGDSVYQQELNPQDQKDYIIEMLKPLAERKLLLGIHAGNHEARIVKGSGIDIVRDMAKFLGVPYLGFACWSLFYVGKQSYALYSLHGKSGSRFEHTKLKAAIDIAHHFDCDLFAMGHTHSCIDNSVLVQRPNRGLKSIVEFKKWIVITGHYLTYDNSYAQEAGYSIGKLGSPKIKLFADHRDIHISW